MSGLRKTDIDKLYDIDSDLLLLAKDKPLINSDQEAARIAKAIYNGDMTTGDIEPALTQMVAEKLAETTKRAFKGRKTNFSTTDYLMVENLQKNAFHFAAAKNYNQIKSMSEALLDHNGKVRSFKDFRRQVEKINRIYNEAWLRTEYETATGAAVNAAQWSRWQARDKEPILTYDAVNDERTRESHKALNGITKPMSDPFWNTYYPPNGWRCRCGVMVAPSERRPSKSSPELAIPKMFKTNLAKDGLLFPLNHPYFLEAPKEIRMKGERLHLKVIQKEAVKAFKGKTIKTPALKSDVHITTKAIKEVINQPHYDLIAKANAVLNIDAVLASAKYVTIADNNKEIRNIKQFHYLSFMLNDKKNYIIIKEDYSGAMTLYTIVDNIKQK